MPFQPGHKLAKGGKREGAGRPRKGQKLAADIIREIIEAKATKLGNQYINRALGEMGDKVLCHAIDKLLPEVAKPAVVFNIKNVEEFNWNEYQAVCIATSSPRVIEAVANSDGIDEPIHPAYSDSQASLISKFTPS